MGGNNEFFENFERKKYLKNYPARRVNSDGLAGMTFWGNASFESCHKLVKCFHCVISSSNLIKNGDFLPLDLDKIYSE